MRLIVDPAPALPVFEQDLDLVICVSEGRAPEIHVKQGIPKPDRHLLLGLVQTVSVVVGEMDRELVCFMEPRSLVLEMETGSRPVQQGLVIARTSDGAFGVLAIEDKRQARVLAREALRWFTGTIRLDIP
jgi:hypothetical protein